MVEDTGAILLSFKLSRTRIFFDWARSISLIFKQVIRALAIGPINRRFRVSALAGPCLEEKKIQESVVSPDLVSAPLCVCFVWSPPQVASICVPPPGEEKVSPDQGEFAMETSSLPPPLFRYVIPAHQVVLVRPSAVGREVMGVIFTPLTR